MVKAKMLTRNAVGYSTDGMWCMTPDSLFTRNVWTANQGKSHRLLAATSLSTRHGLQGWSRMIGCGLTCNNRPIRLIVMLTMANCLNEYITRSDEYGS